MKKTISLVLALGPIDDVRIYSVALTAEQIAMLVQQASIGQKGR